jgi:hypothetical protein
MLDGTDNEVATIEKPRVVRPKATREEHAQRVRFAMLLLAENRSRAYIRGLFRKQFTISTKTVDRIITIATKKMVAEVTKPRAALVAQSFAYYSQIMQDSEASRKDRLRARELADRLLGLPAPSKVAHTTADGKDVHRAAVKDLSDDELRTLLKTHERIGSVSRTDDSGGREAAH